MIIFGSLFTIARNLNAITLINAIIFCRAQEDLQDHQAIQDRRGLS